MSGLHPMSNTRYEPLSCVLTPVGAQAGGGWPQPQAQAALLASAIGVVGGAPGDQNTFWGWVHATQFVGQAVPPSHISKHTMHEDKRLMGGGANNGGRS